jgi:3-methyl-2-oxobutanoate hydroxymethyltransferase
VTTGGRALTVADVRSAKGRGDGGRIVVLTAYDYPTGRMVDEAGVDIVLVGDSLGNVALGFEDTCRVTVEDMLHHTAAVARGVRHALLVADLPFASYRAGADEAVRTAARFLREAGARAVKLEGGADVAPVVTRLVQAGIPVMGHLGLTPQSVNQMGGYRVQARTAGAIATLLADAAALEAAGAFAVVLELVPAEVAALVTERVGIPTIGIGAGAGCDGQVQVLGDIIGFTFGRLPRHARVFGDAGAVVRSAVAAYRDAVAAGTFPAAEQSFRADPAELAAWRAQG